jgi:hypothetical protein
MKLDIFGRALTAVALVALAITLSVWLTRKPLTAAPPAAPAAPQVKTQAEPTLAPSPPTTISVKANEAGSEYEVVPPAGQPAGKPVVADLPQAEPPAAKPQNNCQQYYRRGWFRRR